MDTSGYRSDWPQAELCSKSSLHRCRHASLRETWLHECKRLFSQVESEFQLEAISVGQHVLQVHMIRSEERLRAYLEHLYRRNEICETQEALPRATFICVTPSFGWGRLYLSEAGCNILFSAWDVCPEILPLLRTFGSKSFAADENFSGWHLSTNDLDKNNGGIIECCYSLKYVDNHDDSRDTVNPWSMRQALVYHKFNITTKQCSCFLVRVSCDMELQLRSVLQGDIESAQEFTAGWANIHLLFFGSLIGNWNHCIAYIDMRVTYLFNVVIRSPLASSSHQTSLSSAELYSAIKDIHYLVDQLLRAKNLLGQNAKVMSGIQRKIKDLAPFWAAENFTNSVDTILREHDTLIDSARSLLNRAMNVSNHLRDTINLRNTAVSQHNSRELVAVTGSTDQSSKAILDMSQRSAQDASRTKTLAFAALVFVPASFIAVCLVVAALVQIMKNEKEFGNGY